MKSVRLGIIGLGNMGLGHADNITSGKVRRCEITAVCDPAPEKTARFPHAKIFTRSDELIHSGAVDAVLIATPHFDHTVSGIDALQAGLHVLVEKPISVQKADCERLIAARQDPKLVFAVMFQQRTDQVYRKVRELIQGGELGQIRRINWIITNWFRPEVYYKLGSWRASWAGEGGGVLLNQCPHNLDLFQWFFGMPKRVRGFCGLGRYHDIEVEDDVTAYFEYADGATAVFITSTGEAPGTNRLEIAAENGRLVFENDVLTFTKNETPMSEFSRTATKAFAAPQQQSPGSPSPTTAANTSRCSRISSTPSSTASRSSRPRPRESTPSNWPTRSCFPRPTTRPSSCRWMPPLTKNFYRARSPRRDSSGEQNAPPAR
jgi:predicted dehydrogenase